MIDPNAIGEAIRTGLQWLSAEVRLPWIYIQSAVLLAAALLSWLASAAIRRRSDTGTLAAGLPAPLRLFVNAVIANLGFALFTLALWLGHVVMVAATTPNHSFALSVILSLASAWLVIRLATGFIRDRLVVRLVSVLAWIVAALSILRLLEPTLAALDSWAIKLGGLRVTPLLVIKMTLMMAVALWLANIVSKFIETRVAHINELTPSVQVLIIKFARLALTALAVILVMSAAGIDLSALTIFSGAVGVGVGFGLQKIVGNFVSGIILLADKSIKPGDLITVGDSFGRVSAMNTRYLSLAALDGREVLIPNEDLITQKVVNWTFSNPDTQLHVEFGVSYDCDPFVVRELAIRTARGVPRVIQNPAPVCHFIAFGDSSLNFKLYFWITDPGDGLGNVRSEVLLALWRAFKEARIDIPFPVRDVRMRPAPEGGTAAAAP